MNSVSYQITATGQEALAVADASNYLRIDSYNTQDTALVTALCVGARHLAEGYLNKLIVQSTVTLTIDMFPRVGLKLPYGPVQSVTAINVTDANGEQTVWSSSNYIVDLSGERIVYSPTAVFPDSYAPICAVQVVYVAGWGQAESVSAVPLNVMQALRHLVAFSYENREVPVAIPPSICMLLDRSKKMVI